MTTEALAIHALKCVITVTAMLILMAHAYRVGYADGARNSRNPPSPS